MTAQRFGATDEEWAHFDFVLGLGRDMLPVVSNPNAAISPASKMKALGKTPSKYNGQHQAVGIKDWTSFVAGEADIASWSRNPDLGICLQTRTVRAIDCDINDETQAGEIHAEIERLLLHPLPTRGRSGASKFLCAFTLPDGDLTKRVFKTAHGIVELLATGQQAVVCGTHPSGARYEWRGGLPDAIPALTRAQLEALWSALEAKFATEPSTTSKASSKKVVLEEAARNDPIAVSLYDKGVVKSSERDGRLHVQCPFGSNHSTDSADSSTTYFPAFTGGFEHGRFFCLHAGCASRSQQDFLAALGLADDPADDFEVIAATDNGQVSGIPIYYDIQRAHDFSSGSPLKWIVKGVIPQVELVAIYGPPAVGKSFLALDIVSAVALGEPWQGRKVHQGPVCYVAAEGAAGFRNRLKAMIEAKSLDRETLDLHILAAAPNLLKTPDVVKLGNSVNQIGRFSIIVVDTLAQTMTGGDENSAQDMGIVIANCKALSQATGAVVVLITHTGKDATKGMRGSSALLGAIEAGIEISRDDHNRTATITKMKDGEDSTQFGFTLRAVPIGRDEDGDVISSCIVEHGEVVAPRAKPKRLGVRNEKVQALIRDNISVGNNTVLAQTVIDAYLAVTDRGTSVNDHRITHCNTSINFLCTMGWCKRVAPDQISIIGSEE